jgi:hypothetical protein
MQYRVEFNGSISFGFTSDGLFWMIEYLRLNPKMRWTRAEYILAIVVKSPCP